jgi:flagellar export protein FliJ
VAFRFTLEQVLRVRESIERREELALQRAEFEVACVKRRIEELTQELAAASRRRDEALQEPMQAYLLQGMDAEINAALEARQQSIEKLKVVQAQRDQQRAIYQVAHNGRQMLTDFRKQQRIEYELEEVKAQQKKIDDLFAARIQRQ